MVRTIKDYFQSLAELSTATPLERLELDLLKVQEEVQKISNILWQAWLDLLPKRLFHHRLTGILLTSLIPY